jgi:hypothetical protein
VWGLFCADGCFFRLLPEGVAEVVGPFVAFVAYEIRGGLRPKEAEKARVPLDPEISQSVERGRDGGAADASEIV